MAALPTIFIILGATGDLMRKKLAPTLFHMYKEGKLPSLFQAVGFSRDDHDTQSFRRLVAGMIGQGDASEAQRFLSAFSYQQGSFEEKDGYAALAEFLGRRDKEWKVCSNKLFYLAVPPQSYSAILENLHDSGLTEPCGPEEGWTRVIVEKPFGKDLKTARELDRVLGKLFAEEQIYRMDHYLGKETVQNILAFRFFNSFLEPAWNRKWIERVIVRLLEKSGIGERGAFYEGIGALRDVGQNHVLQLLALFFMENPVVFEGEAIRNERAKVLKSLKVPNLKNNPDSAIRGQYEGYRKEKNVARDSTTETFFRIHTSVDSERWKGVPVTLESAKGASGDLVEVEVVFRHASPCLCPDKKKHCKNVLHYTIQPDEGASLTFWVKRPGTAMDIEERAFTFNYREAFEGDEFQEAYERLLCNIIQGEQTLFVSTEEIKASWKFVDAILRGWELHDAPLLSYPMGAELTEH